MYWWEMVSSYAHLSLLEWIRICVCVRRNIFGSYYVSGIVPDILHVLSYLIFSITLGD